MLYQRDMLCIFKYRAEIVSDKYFYNKNPISLQPNNYRYLLKFAISDRTLFTNLMTHRPLLPYTTINRYVEIVMSI